MWFDKPLSALLTPGQALKLEKSHVDVHHEVELGVVIGMRGRNISPENAHRHIAGYFIGVDFCNRVLQRRNNGDGSDWCMAKGSNKFAAVSEYIHKSAIPDSANVDIELQINGETRQKENTSRMIFDVPTMIADISKYQELREGDLLFTGTPDGVGAVKAGDHVVCCLRNGADEANLATLSIRVE